jgi:APA family basic amino acid/polyamine antiporter
VLIAGLAAMGNLKMTWSLSAFMVLCYYAITNIAALKLGAEQRRYPKWISWLGLVSCVALCWWIEPLALYLGFSLLASGLIGRAVLKFFFHLMGSEK